MAAGDPLIRRQLNTPDQVYSAPDHAPLGSEASMDTRSKTAAEAADGAGRTAGRAPFASGRGFA
jgi:hypothetical protein